MTASERKRRGEEKGEKGGGGECLSVKCACESAGLSAGAAGTVASLLGFDGSVAQCGQTCAPFRIRLSASLVVLVSTS